MSKPTTTAGPPFHLMTKPSGPLCNLDCEYCFYLDKHKLYPDETAFRMSDEVLRAYIEQQAAAQVGDLTFSWQGGEPTLMGIEFFERAVQLQKRIAPASRRVSNTFQTNGVLIDERWAEFFGREKFLVGLSIDGPRELHDAYRVNKGGAPTFERVMVGLRHLIARRVAVNTMTVVGRRNSQFPLEVYRFLRDHGSGHIQFIPLVERRNKPGGLFELAGPPDGDRHAPRVTEWSVRSRDWGDFLCAVFDEWVRHDVGRVFVHNFETFVGILAGEPSNSCVFAPTCGRALALEHNGDVYACDHYVYPEYLRGNILHEPLGDMVNSVDQFGFGDEKYSALPKYCRSCEFLTTCYGECPKHRFIRTPTGEPGLNYLCTGYKRFFEHARAPLQEIVSLIGQGRPASDVMKSGAR